MWHSHTACPKFRTRTKTKGYNAFKLATRKIWHCCSRFLIRFLPACLIPLIRLIQLFGQLIRYQCLRRAVSIQSLHTIQPGRHIGTIHTGQILINTRHYSLRWEVGSAEAEKVKYAVSILSTLWLTLDQLLLIWIQSGTQQYKLLFLAPSRVISWYLSILKHSRVFGCLSCCADPSHSKSLSFTMEISEFCRGFRSLMSI